jgi:hypothetical protein
VSREDIASVHSQERNTSTGDGSLLHGICMFIDVMVHCRDGFVVTRSTTVADLFYSNDINPDVWPG